MNKPISKFFEQRGVFGLGESVSTIFFGEYIVELQESMFNLLALPVVFDLHMLNPTMNRGIPREALSSIIISIYYNGLINEITEFVAQLL